MPTTKIGTTFKDEGRTVMRKFVNFGALLTAFAVIGSMALAQEPTDHSAHHGQTDEQTEHPSIGGGGSTMGGEMGPGMMQGGMGPGMMHGMGALFGSRVTPIMNLSVEDVSGYLDAQLDGLNNKRLKVGDVKSDDGSITADIVTVDNSLVQRLKVNRHTGDIEYQN
jgi:hypothetical protein